DARRVRLDLRWHEDGRLTGASTDTLVGQEAIVVGATLAQLDAARRPRLVERLLLPAVGAAQVESFADPIEDDPDGPLTMRSRFVVQGGDQLALGLAPVSPGRSHARLADRALPLALDLPTHQTVHLVLESDRPFTGAPSDVTLTWGPHRFTRRVEVDDDRVEIHSELVVAGGLIAPEDYPAFAKWARQVDAAERFTLVAR
ncbi:MAG: hypothetical protein KC583_07890, partial [Myxococcales bacterium]|nr:hypothetical protein [Myxococcales bacterium]